MYLNTKSIDAKINEIDKLTAVSNTMVLLVEMSVAERKEVLPFVQTMYPDFKKYYGATVITTEGLVDTIGKVIYSTIRFVKNVLREMIALLSRIIFFWKKKGTDPVSKFMGSVDADTNEIIQHTKDNYPDPNVIRDRATACSTIAKELFKIASAMHNTPLTFNKTHEQLVNAAFNGSPTKWNDIGITTTNTHTIHVEDILKTKENMAAISHISTLIDINSLSISMNLFQQGGRQRCADAYGEVLAAAKNLSNYIDDLEHKYKAITGGTQYAVVPHGHKFSEEETEHLNKVKQFNYIVNSFRWVTKGYSTLGGLNHDLFKFEKYLKERNAMCDRFNKKHGVGG